MFPHPESYKRHTTIAPAAESDDDDDAFDDDAAQNNTDVSNNTKNDFLSVDQLEYYKRWWLELEDKRKKWKALRYDKKLQPEAFQRRMKKLKEISKTKSYIKCRLDPVKREARKKKDRERLARLRYEDGESDDESNPVVSGLLCRLARAILRRI